MPNNKPRSLFDFVILAAIGVVFAVVLIAPWIFDNGDFVR
jgi:hypothetical protein